MKKTHCLQTVALLDRMANAERVVLGAGQQDRVQVRRILHHLQLVLAIPQVDVLFSNWVELLTGPLDDFIRPRGDHSQVGHQLGLPLRPLGLVAFVCDRTADAPGVRHGHLWRLGGADQLSQSVEVLGHQHLQVFAVHPLHLPNHLTHHLHADSHGGSSEVSELRYHARLQW